MGVRKVGENANQDPEAHTVWSLRMPLVVVERVHI